MSCNKYLILIGLIALTPRLLFVIFAGHSPLQLDEIEYDRIAWNLVEGKGYTWFFNIPCTFRSPGYPSFLAVIYLIFGPDYFIARIFSAFLGASHAVLTVKLGEKIFGPMVGRLAGFAVALYFPLIFFSYTLMSENLFITLFLCALIFFANWSNTGETKQAVLAAIFFGLDHFNKTLFCIVYVVTTSLVLLSTPS